MMSMRGTLRMSQVDIRQVCGAITQSQPRSSNCARVISLRSRIFFCSRLFPDFA
jgi:hypothetical protein